MTGRSYLGTPSDGVVLAAVPGGDRHIRGALQANLAVKCKPMGECDGKFDYLPRLQDESLVKSADEVARCIGEFSTKGAEERSRFNEDLIVYKNFFKSSASIGSGFFLELGAFDGMAEANTRLFEECLGWKVNGQLSRSFSAGCPGNLIISWYLQGLLIEAQPQSFNALKSHANFRPHSDMLLAAPSCRNFETARIMDMSSTGISMVGYLIHSFIPNFTATQNYNTIQLY